MIDTNIQNLTWLEPRMSTAKSGEPCYYCGLVADSIDHTVSKVFLINLAEDDEARESITRGRKLTVPACCQCNSLLGGGFDNTLAARKQRLKGLLRKKYKHYLNIPDWGDGEMEGLSSGLQGYIAVGIARRDLIRKRLAW